MNHGISENEWEGYLNGTLAAAQRDQVDAHLIGCVPCWEFHQRMAALDAQLRQAGEARRDGFPLSDEKLQAGLHNVFARIHAQHRADEPDLVRQRLHELEAMMTVFCGTEVAASALQTAAQRSSAHSLKQVTRENWESFLQRLIAIAQVLCGRTGASWLLESGRL